MDLMLIIVGMAFMLNPMIAILDIFPDFIGCILILIGLNRISSISPELDDARPYFRYMMYASLARTLIFFASGTFDDVMRLSVTLIFGVIEFGLAVMAIPALYDGLAYLNIRHGGKPKEIPEFKTVGIIFFAARGIFAIIPQLGSVMNSGDDELITPGSGDQLLNDWTEYSDILTLVGIILTLIFAAFWYTAVISYIGRLSRDEQFIASLKDAYKYKRETEPGYFIRKRLLTSFVIMSVASFFLIDLIGDGVNCIPDFPFGIFMIVALWVISPYTDKTKIKKAMIFGSIYTFLSLINFIYFNIFMKNRFFASFDYLITHYIFEYIAAVVTALAEAVALILFAYHLFYPLLPIVEKQITADVPEEFVRTAKRNEKFVLGTIKILKAYCISLSVTGVSTLLFSALLHPFPIYWMIHLAVNIVFFCITMALTTRLSIGVRKRYERPEDI